MRCQQPPRARKVPLYFNGWLLFDDSCVKSEDGNWFLACQLLQDRTGAILNSFVTGFSVKKKHPLYGRLTLIHQLFIHSFIHSFILSFIINVHDRVYPVSHMQPTVLGQGDKSGVSLASGSIVHCPSGKQGCHSACVRGT